MNCMKKIISFVIALFFLLQVPSYANGAEEGGECHFVIVYDISRSMNEVDNENNIQDKIAVFLENIPANSYPAKVLVLPFAGTCPAVRTMESSENVTWWEIEEYHDKEIPDIKEALSKLQYTEEYTDIERALQTCQNELLKMRESAGNCKQVVLFMTDGLPDLAGDGEEKFKSLWESYNNILSIAETFPNDVAFLGITPDVENLKDDLKYNESHNRITEYYGNLVPEQYGEKMVQVSKCMQRFCEILRERQKDQKYLAELKEIDWQSPEFNNIMKNAYKDFYKMVFEANVTEKSQQNLAKGVSFRVPDTVSEIDINISFDAFESKEREEIIQECLQNLHFTRENGKCKEPYISDTKNSVIIKLIDPIADNYTIHCEGIKSADLQFYAYGSLHIGSFAEQRYGVVGEELCLSGEILNEVKQRISENERQFVKLYVNEEELDNSCESFYEEGCWKIKFTPQRTGEYTVKLTVEYDDTIMKDNPWGVSCFYSIELFDVIVKENETVLTTFSLNTEPTNEKTKTHAVTTTEIEVAEDNFDNSFFEMIKSICEKYWWFIFCGCMLVVVIVVVVKRSHCRQFRVYMSDGKSHTITIPSRTYFEDTKIKGLTIHWEKNVQEYMYNGNGPYPILNDEIHLN